MDTLAAAYAEAGQFPDAVATARDALQRATVQGNQHLVESLRKRIKLYGEGQPWRDGAAGNGEEPLNSGGAGIMIMASIFLSAIFLFCILDLGRCAGSV